MTIIHPKRAPQRGSITTQSCVSRSDKRMPVQITIARGFWSVGLLCGLVCATVAYGQPSKTSGSAEWDFLVDAAKKEGKVTISIPASAEMRKQIEDHFKKRYGIEVEIFTARGSAGVRRMADEFKAGVRHFDLHVGGSASIISGMLDEGILDPIEPWLVLPEVKDPKRWWGGHLWVRSEERRVGKECRWRWGTDDDKVQSIR